MPNQTIFCIPDTHVPFHNKAAWNLTLKAIKTLKPTKTVIMGDFADFYAASHFPKSPTRQNLLKSEIKDVKAELRRLQELVGRSAIYLEGNHEWRLERYLTAKAPELFGLVEPADLLNVQQFGWDWVPYHRHAQIGRVLFTHDFGHSGKYAGFQTLDAAGSCVVFGHTHRGSVAYGGTVDGDHRFALNVGWLGDSNRVDYMHRAKTRDWQLGFGWINMDSKGRAWAQFCPIVGNKVCVDGEWIHGS